MRAIIHKQQGFTLLELIIAISIFGVIMAMAYGALRHIADTAHHLEQRSEQLADLQRAFFIINKDLQQLVDRKIRDQFGDEQPALIVDGEGRVEFTRAGWRNPLGQLRSSLQRVAYRLEEGVLYRDYWRVLDRAQDSEPLSSDIMHNIEAFEVELLPPGSEEWQTSWPPYSNNSEQVAAPLPKMVKVNITLEGVGNIWRFYTVAQGE